MSGDDESRRTRFEWWLEDISVDPATRVAGAILIILGSVLGVITGSLHISADIGDVLNDQADASEGLADVNGGVYSAIIDNNTGGEGMEGVTVVLENEDGDEIGRSVTDSEGRFTIADIARQSSVIVVEHPEYVTQRVLLIPGDHAQISITLTEGTGSLESDMRGYSHLKDSVLITTIVGTLTLLAGIAGLFGGVEAYNGKNHFRTQFLAYLGLWSQGLMFIGPFLILIGMALSYLTRDQFGILDGA